MTTNRKHVVEHSYLFKASWRGTSLKFWISAPTEKQARARAERQILAQEGGNHCLGLDILEVR